VGSEFAGQFRESVGRHAGFSGFIFLRQIFLGQICRFFEFDAGQCSGAGFGLFAGRAISSGFIFIVRRESRAATESGAASLGPRQC